jgi:cobalt/nickel transport system ATP-binding protein
MVVTEAVAAPPAYALELRGLSFHFEDGTPALEGISCHVAVGERVALVGPNGAGKSTLLLHLVGLLPEAGRGHGEGDVILFGDRVGPHTAHAARRQVGILFQDPDDQLFCSTVREDVAFGPQQLGLRGAALDGRVATALEKVGLGGFEDRAPHRLSGGEKKRVALAGVLACEPRILAFDEPTSGLDPRSRRQLIALLAGLDVTCVIATHDLALVAELCARTLVLDGGRLVAEGPTRTLLRDDARMRAHGLETPRDDLPARLLEDADPLEPPARAG